MNLFDPIDAEKIYANAQKHGLKVGQTPKLGAMIVWQKGSASRTDGAGHVAVVEEIGVGGEIKTSESGYGASKMFWNSTYKSPYKYKDGYKFLGFVYQPEIPKKALREGDKGDDVIWMQERLAERGYLRREEIDGSFGIITLGALLAFQFKNGLEVDGVCGSKTRAALMK